MTITPPRGTSGSARTASRNWRRRPQPGEPRHAANAPAFEETPAPRRRNPRHEEPADGLGAQLYEVMSDSERETAVAETLLFKRPTFDDEPRPITDTGLFARVEFTAAEPASADLPVTIEPPAPPAAETILFTRPPDWEEAADRHLASREPSPVRREVTPLTETFLFGTAPGRHAQEPRSPVDGTAETLLFAGLARALATQPEPVAEPPAATWRTPAPVAEPLVEMPAATWATAAPAEDGIALRGDPGWAPSPYQQIVEKDHRIAEESRRTWDELDRNAAQPLPQTRRKRKTFPEDFEMGAAGLDRPGRVVNRRRPRPVAPDRAVPDRDVLPPENAWQPDYSQVSEPLPEPLEPLELPEEEEPAAATAPEQDTFAGGRKLSPEAEAAWKAFAHGDREPGTEIRTNRRAKSRWTTSIPGDAPEEKPKRRIFLWPAVLRCLLYLGPVSVAVTGADMLAHVSWPVLAATLVLGWGAAQALTSVGVTVARRAGPEASVRLIGAGFAAVAALWCALVWVAPGGLLGSDRLLSASVGAGGLATLATVTAALVSRSEAAVTGWYLPCWLLAATALAEDSGAGWAHYVPVETLLPAMVVAVLIRAFRPAVLLGRECRIPRLTSVERRRGITYLVIGVSQGLCVALLWRAGPDVTPSLVALPLLLAVPMLEALIGWHTARIDAGLDSAETVADLDRHVRNVTVITLAGLLPPLAAGGALALAAYQLPYQLSHLGATQSAVLALAAGTLLGGVFAITFLLAARSRTGLAATLATAPSLATLALPLLPQPDAGPLPLAVAVLAATHVAGLLIVALTAADLRRTS